MNFFLLSASMVVWWRIGGLEFSVCFLHQYRGRTASNPSPFPSLEILEAASWGVLAPAPISSLLGGIEGFD